MGASPGTVIPPPPPGYELEPDAIPPPPPGYALEGEKLRDLAPPPAIGPNAGAINTTLRKYGPNLDAPTGYMGAPSVPFDTDAVARGAATNLSKIAYGMAKAATLNPQMGASFHRAEPTPQEKQIIGEAPNTVPIPISAGFQPGLMKGVTQGLETLTTPQNAAVMAGTGGLGALASVAGGARVGQAVNTVLGAYFAAQMAKGASEGVKRAYQKHINGDDQGAIQELGFASTEAFLAAMGVRHGVKNIREMAGTPSTPTPKGPPADHPDTYPAAQYGVPRLNAPAGEVGAAPTAPPEPPKPTKVDHVSEDTPVPPTSWHPTTPETPETMAAQMEQLQQGKRKVVMYPKGTPQPTSFPPDVNADGSPKFGVTGQDGHTFVYNRGMIDRATIKSAVKNNKLNEILGDADMGMGVPDKSAIPPDSPTIVTRDAQGNEVHAALTPETHAQTAVEVAKRLMPEGGSVDVEPPASVIGQRMAEFGGSGLPTQPPAPYVPQKPFSDPDPTVARTPEEMARLGQGQAPISGGTGLADRIVAARTFVQAADPNDLISTSTLQRQFRIGYGSAKAILDNNRPGWAAKFGQGQAPTQTFPAPAPQPIGAPAGGIPVGPVTPNITPPPVAKGDVPSGERFRGSIEFPLNGNGVKTAQEAAAKNPNAFTRMIASTLGRTGETQQIMATTNPQASLSRTDALRPMHLGGLEGTPVTPEAINWMNNHMVQHPDVPFPGVSQSGVPGESFNQFRDRVATHFLQQLRDYHTGQRILNITHYRDIQLVNSLLKGRMTSIDMDEMTRKGDQKPGDLFKLDLKTNKLKPVDSAFDDPSEPQIYYQRHGETVANEGAAGGSQKGANRPEQTAGPVASNAQAPAGIPTNTDNVYAMDPRLIEADPARFQFKSATGGKTGTGELLKDLKAYDRPSGGTIAVWHDPADGKTYVVNGHHRLELAKRTNAPLVDVRYLQVKTAPEAYAAGALLNIREGSGTPIDAAKVFRGLGVTPQELEDRGVSLRGKVAHDGMALAQLAPSIFDKVVQGELPIERAVMIGEMLPDHQQQKQALDLLGSGKSMTNGQAHELIRFAANAPEVEEEPENFNLFGEDTIKRNLIKEKAEVSDYIRQQLSQTRRIFSATGQQGNAEKLAQSGNVIKAEENARIAQETAQVEAVYDKLSLSSGPISDALNEAATRLANGEPAAKVKQDALEQVKRAVNQIIPSSNGGSQSKSAAGGGGPSEGGSAAAGIAESRQPIQTPSFPLEAYQPSKSTQWHADNAKTREIATPDDQVIALIANPSAMELFGRALKEADDTGQGRRGLYLPPKHVFEVAVKMGNLPKGKGTAPMVAAFQEASLNNKGIILAKMRDGDNPGDIQQTLREELNHAKQDRLDWRGVDQHLYGDEQPDIAAIRFENYPLTKKAIMHLELFYGYDLSSRYKAAAEVGVRLMVPGRFKEMGLTVQEGRRLAAKYIKELRRAYGKTKPAEIAKDVFDALRPSRASANRAAQSNAVAPSAGLGRRGGAATTTGPPVSADVEGHSAAVQPRSAEGGKSADTWTPWSQRNAGLFSDAESASTAADVAKDRDKLQGERLTAQFNSPITRGEQKLRRKPVEQSGLFEEPKPEKAQKGLFEAREKGEPWQDEKLKKLSPEANQLWKKLEDIEPITDLPVSIADIDLPHDVMTKGAQELHKAGLIYGTLHDGTQSIPDDLLIPTGNKSHYGGEGQWINISRRGEPVKPSSVTLGAGLGPLEPFLRESIRDIKEGLEQGRLAREALERGKATPGNKEDGHQILRYTTSEEDWWKARVNQAVEKLEREVPARLDRQAIMIMRDFAKNPGEIRKWLDGTAADYPTTPEGIRNIKRVETIIKRAAAPSQKMIDVNRALTSIAEVSYHEGKRLGILDSSLTPDEYVAHLLRPKDEPDYPENKDRPRGLGSRLTNHFANAQKRFYPTVLHAIADNVKPQTLDALDAFRIYGDRFARRRATELLKKEIINTKIGFWGKDKAPKGYVPLAPHNDVFKRDFVGKDEEGNPQVGHTQVYVPPWLEKALRPITDPDATQFIHGFKTLQAYQGYIKAAQLSLSLFHLYTENAVSLADVGPVGRWKIANMDRYSAVFQRAELYAVRRGVKTTVIDHAKDAWRRLDPGPIPTLGDLAKRLPVLKQADQLGDAIGEYTFNNFIRKAKVFSFFSRAAEWRASHPQASEEATIRAEQSIAKYVNAAYGGLHWENMGMGKTAQNLSRIVMMAPDWVYSNYVLGKYAAFDWRDPETGKLSVTGNPAGHLSRKFFLKTLLYGAIGTAVLSYMFTGKWHNDLTRVHFGKDEKGRDIVANLAFRASAGDMVSLAHNISQYGLGLGLARTYANKAAAIPRAGLHLYANNTGQAGQEIWKKGMNPVASTVRAAKTVATDVSPVPFIFSNAMKASEEDPKWWEYLIMVLTGQPPSHVKPEGMHKVKGQYVPEKPKPEGAENSTWDQIRTGHVYKSKKEMRDLGTPAPY